MTTNLQPRRWRTSSIENRQALFVSVTFIAQYRAPPQQLRNATTFYSKSNKAGKIAQQLELGRKAHHCTNAYC